MKFEAAACSAKGIRELNEDSFIIASVINEMAQPFSSESVSGDDTWLSFFAVADGMGGQGSGEKASNLVVTELKKLSEEKKILSEEELKTAINTIHQLVLQTNAKMGATLTGIIFQKGECGIVNLGDSRTYRLRNGMFMKMTNDDSLSNLVAGAPSNIITNGIGGGLSNISVNSRFSEMLVMPGDIFLMCSDGVHGYVTDEELEKLMSAEISPKGKAATIVQKAIANHTDDNCTAVILQISE